MRNRLQRLQRHEWPAFFHQVARGISHRRVEVEVSCMLPGGELVARWLPLFALAHESAAETVRIELAEFELRIERLRSIHVDGPPLNWRHMILIDGEGHAQRLHVREQLRLSANVAAHAPARAEPPTPA